MIALCLTALFFVQIGHLQVGYLVAGLETSRENRCVMAGRRNRKKSHWQRRAMALGFCTLFCLGQGCYEQKVVDRDTFGPVPDGDEYEVDIYLISELAGRFLAQKKSGETVICGDFGKEGTETNTCAMPSFPFNDSPVAQE